MWRFPGGERPEKGGYRARGREYQPSGNRRCAASLSCNHRRRSGGEDAGKAGGRGPRLGEGGGARARCRQRQRTEERRGGKECVSTCSSRLSTDPYTKHISALLSHIPSRL